MKKTYRYTAVAVAFLLGGGALAGCSTDVSDGGSTASGDSATSLIASDTASAEAAIELMKKDNSDISVDMQTAPGNTYAQVVATQLAGGTAADIVRAYPGNGSGLSIVQGSENGFFASLDDLDFVKDLTDADASVLRNAAGEIVAVPTTVSAIGGVYNQTAVDAAGLEIPTTWSDMLAFCGEARDQGLVAYGLGLKDAWTSQFVSYALGASLFPDDIAEQQAESDEPFSGTEWAAVIQKYADMRDAGCFTAQPNGTSAANVSADVATGEVLATISLTTMIADISNQAPSDTEIVFAPIPATDNAEETKLSTGIGVVFALNSKAKNPEAAKEVLEFFATPEAQVAFAEGEDMAPALGVPDDYVADQPSTLIQEYTEKNLTSPWPDQSWPNPNVQQVHFTALQSLFAGDASVDDVLTELDKAYKG